jgi:hypothetical protein
MKLWTIWLMADDGYVWCEDTWTDDATAENHEGWQESVDKAQRLANDNKGYAMRVIALQVPDEGIYGAFEVPTVAANASTVEGAS